MELIKLFFLGATGYLLAGLYDVAILYDKPLLRRLLYLGFFITAIPYPVIFFTWDSPLPALVGWIVFSLVFVFAALLVYSVMVEIPLFAPGEGKLYQKGTYSFSRHPGFIWYSIVNILVSIYYWNYRITMLMMGLTLCNLVLVVVEDRILFPRMFAEYGEYRRRTPFIL
jgi:protein-S-isoprenylcysteine O-methyltransferase Ste14